MTTNLTEKAYRHAVKKIIAIKVLKTRGKADLVLRDVHTSTFFKLKINPVYVACVEIQDEKKTGRFKNFTHLRFPFPISHFPFPILKNQKLILGLERPC
jgi:hypothetical protein